MIFQRGHKGLPLALTVLVLCSFSASAVEIDRMVEGIPAEMGMPLELSPVALGNAVDFPLLSAGLGAVEESASVFKVPNEVPRLPPTRSGYKALNRRFLGSSPRQVVSRGPVLSASVAMTVKKNTPAELSRLKGLASLRLGQAFDSIRSFFDGAAYNAAHSPQPRSVF